MGSFSVLSLHSINILCMKDWRFPLASGSPIIDMITLVYLPVDVVIL